MALEDLLHPTSIKIDDYGKNATKFSFKPLNRGFGYTFGFALKQTMLYSIGGSCITSIKINNGKITSLEDALPCKESVADIILNLKDLAVVLDDGIDSGIATFELSKVAKEVFFKDAKLSQGLTIKNEQAFICNYTGSKKLKIEVKVERGVGYRSAKESFEQGEFLLDASFSPVTFCEFEVKNARVGRLTNLDRLDLDVKTNGNIAAEEAIRLAARGIQNQLKNIVNVEEINKNLFIEDPKDNIDPALLKDIKELDLSVRSLNCLKDLNIQYVGQLIQKTDKNLLKSPNLGKKSLDEIKEKLSELSLVLGTVVNNWPEDL